jgi:hypothetical protein
MRLEPGSWRGNRLRAFKHPRWASAAISVRSGMLGVAALARGRALVAFLDRAARPQEKRASRPFGLRSMTPLLSAGANISRQRVCLLAHDTKLLRSTAERIARATSAAPRSAALAAA